MENGAQYVMWGLTNKMLMSYADNLDSQVNSRLI